MTLQELCDMLYYVYILLFGVYSAMKVACGRLGRREATLAVILCPSLLLVQGVMLEWLGMDWIWRLYPLIAHLPIVLVLTWRMRVKWDAAFLSVIISYALCQMMRWVGLVVELFCHSPVAALIIHLSLCMILFFLLDRYCLQALHDVLSHSEKLFRIFGALPVVYYLYEYFMLWTQRRFAQLLAFQELLPTAMLLFFTLFILVFRREGEKFRQTEQQGFILAMELDHARREVSTLRKVQEQTAIHRHDMRHHLGMISSFLAAGKTEQAVDYIHRTVGEIEAITPRRYCENETVNLLLCAFREKAERSGVTMAVRAALPARTGLQDTELCVILSNGLENALHAAACLPESVERKIGVYIGEHRNKLLIEIKNPFVGEVAIQDGLPVAEGREPHYGCRSILSMVQRRGGICTFTAEKGLFLLQIAIPMA